MGKLEWADGIGRCAVKRNNKYDHEMCKMVASKGGEEGSGRRVGACS